MEEEDYKNSLMDYLLAIKRRWVLAISTFTLVFAIVIIVTITIPPVFYSEGTILIESQKIPNDLIQSTVTSFANERIQMIQQLVMTRENLIRIIDKYELFSKSGTDLTVSEKIGLTLNSISIEQVKGEGRTALAFKVGYEDESPRIAHAVANELVTLFLEENVKNRTRRASETTAFLKQEARKLKLDLEIIEEKIANYKQKYSDSLPEHLDLHIKMLERAESGILRLERDIQTASNELRFLRLEMSTFQNLPDVNTQSNKPLTKHQALSAAEAELARLQVRYSPRHPDVIKQKHNIEILKIMAHSSSELADNTDYSPQIDDIDTARVDAKITSAIERKASLERELEQLIKERNRLENVVIETPLLQKELTSLNRDHENTLTKYKEIQSKELQAKISESLEEAKKAERFSLLEPPVFPENPIKPDRKIIAAAGLAASIAVAIVLVIFLEFRGGQLYGARPLTYIVGERPLVVIPYMTTSEEMAHTRMLKRSLLFGGSITVLILLFGIHILLIPLDQLLLKMAAKVG